MDTRFPHLVSQEELDAEDRAERTARAARRRESIFRFAADMFLAFSFGVALGASLSVFAAPNPF